jgi:hypothetical protein
MIQEEDRIKPPPTIPPKINHAKIYNSKYMILVKLESIFKLTKAMKAMVINPIKILK